jgi:hypothetical protein
MNLIIAFLKGIFSPILEAFRTRRHDREAKEAAKNEVAIDAHEETIKNLQEAKEIDEEFDRGKPRSFDDLVDGMRSKED